jgi:hypothetical protein
MASIAINGQGRIGRAALRTLEQADSAEVVAVNDPVPVDNLAHLLRYDAVDGHWPTTGTADGDALVVGGRKIPVLSRRDLAGLPWRDLDVDLVLECAGTFRPAGLGSGRGNDQGGGRRHGQGHELLRQRVGVHLPDDPGGVHRPRSAGARSHPDPALKP